MARLLWIQKYVCLLSVAFSVELNDLSCYVAVAASIIRCDRSRKYGVARELIQGNNTEHTNIT